MDRVHSLARLKPRNRIAGIVLHTTGSGPWKRSRTNPSAYPLPYDSARHLYERVMKHSPHYLVCGDTGRIASINNVSLQAQHVGSRGAWRYRLDNWPGRKDLSWWFARFPGLRSPRDLFGGALWTDGSANALSIGIEVAPPKAGAREPWSSACWRSLEELVTWLCLEHGIPQDREHVITHSDAHPLARINRRGAPWDPGPTQWNLASNHLGLA